MGSSPALAHSGIYFTLSKADAENMAALYAGGPTNYITEYFDQSVPNGGDEPTPSAAPGVQQVVYYQPGGTSTDLDFRDADNGNPTAAGNTATIVNVALTAKVATISTVAAPTFSVGQTVTVSGLANSFFDGTFTITSVGSTTAITAVALNNNVATITTLSAPNFVVGEPITVTGLTNTEFDGVYTISAVSATGFSYSLTGANIATTPDSGTAIYTNDFTYVLNHADFPSTPDPGVGGVLGTASTPDPTASIQVNGILGEPLQPPDTTQNWVLQSVKIASHELGHLLGLHHGDSFGPIGQGIMPLPAGPLYTYDPSYPGPEDAAETFDHIITSGDSVGADRWNDIRGLFFGEREDVVLAFSFTAPAMPGPEGSLLVAKQAVQSTAADPQQLQLAPMLVPNTENYGQDAGKTFEVQAVDVLGTTSLDNNGVSDQDYYSFTGSAGEVMNIDAMSGGISRDGPANYIDPVVYLYYKDPVTGAFRPRAVLRRNDRANGTYAYNISVFEASAVQDAGLVDLVLPKTGTYVAEVTSYSGHETGNYELFMYSFKTGVTSSGSDTFIPASGSATIIGGSGNSDQITNALAANFNAFVGDTRTFTVATLTGLSGSGNYTATIGWGGGSSSPATVSINGNQVTILGSHPYADPGTYPLSIAISEDSVTVDLTGQATVSADPIATTVSAPTITYGQNGTVTVTVTAPYATPTDAVSLTVAGAASVSETGTATGISNGQFYRTDTFSVTGLGAGSHNLSVSYSASTDFQTSSASGSLTVNADATATTASAPTITYGQNGTVTVTVTAPYAAPTDAVSLTVAGAASVSETGTATGTSNGQFYRTDTFSVAGLQAGTHNVSVSTAPRRTFKAAARAAA